MNRKRYTSDPRYSKVLDNMDLLGIMDITTTRQAKNGTIVWKLPIKNWNSGKTNIEVASFSTGYVRNQNSGYSNYQLNKRKFDDEYFQHNEWKTINGEYQQVKIPGQYRKWSRKTCVLIPIEIDRLEYLISYCLKNYYIKRANQVADGEFIPKWKLENSISAYEYKLERQKEQSCDELSDFRDSQEWQNKQDVATRVRELDLQNKLDTIKRIADYE